MEYGYIRVSSIDQNEDRQLIALRGKGVQKLATGILTDEQFQQLNGRYLAEQETLKEHTAHLETELAKQQDELDNVGNFLAVVDRHLEVPGRMLEILREFVHHITVHERFSAYKKKFYAQEIDVSFHYIGMIQ